MESGVVDRVKRPMLIEPEVALPLRIGNEVAHTPKDVIYVLTRYLAGQCDGAHTPDGHGFNKVHADFGHKLAELPFEMWTDRQVWAARNMLGRYKNTQIKEWWPAVPEIPEPPKPVEQQKRDDGYAAWKRKQDPTWTPPATFRTLLLEEVNGSPAIELRQSYDESLIAAIKRLPQRKYDPDKKRWYVPLHFEALEKTLEFALEWNYTIPDNVHQAVERVMDEFTARIELSHAAAGDLHIPGLGGELFPFQKAGVQYAQRVGNVLIGDEMGLGKTPQSLATIKAGNNFPAIVICPASLKRNWEREARKWIPGIRVAVLAGKPMPLLNWDGTPAYDLLIVNYNSRILAKWVEAFIAFKPAAIIADECHALKNNKAQQTKLVQHLIDNTQARRIFLSGTPVVNRPMEFWQLIKMLGYDKAIGGFAEYRRRYDNSSTERLRELNQRVRQIFFVRRMKKDVLTELPDKLRVSIPLEIDNAEAYHRAEADIARYFAEKKSADQAFLAEARREAKALSRKTGEAEDTVYEKIVKAHYNANYLIAAQNEQLLRWEALKQLACRGKMKAIHQWITDFLENSDQKLVLFGSHKDFIAEIVRTHRAKYGAVFIDGSVPPDDRMKIVDEFQGNTKCRLFVGNMIAAGEGLTLTAASNVAFFEFGWNPKTHSQAEDRCHRIGQKDSVTVYSLVAENTIDEEIVALIESKRQIVDAIQDGAGADTQRQIMTELKQRMDLRRKGIRVAPVGLIDGDDEE